MIKGKEADIQVSVWKERYRIFAMNFLFFLGPLASIMSYCFFREGFFGSFSKINFFGGGMIMWYCILFSLVIAIFLTYAYVSYRSPKVEKGLTKESDLVGEGETFIRGAQVTEGPAKATVEIVKKDMKSSGLAPVMVAGAPYPYSLENMGMYIQGSAGSGKSQVIKQMIYDIRRRGGRDRLVIYDRKPEFLPLFYRTNDIIICPADRRHTKWDLFAEISGEQDLDGIIKSLFPDLPGTNANDKFWIDSARGVFKGILVYLLNCASRIGRKPNMRDLVLLLANTTSSPAKLKDILWRDNTASYYAGSLSDADNERATVPTSVMSTLNTYVGSFMRPEVAEPGWFSVRKWLRDPGTEGQALFLANPAKYESNYRSYFTCILDLALKEMISMPGDINRRTWFFIDEFGSLFRLDSIIRLLAEGRSKGACTVIGTQDKAQIKEQYKEQAETLLNNCNSKVFGRVSSFEEAEYVSKMIGVMEIERDENDKINYSMDSRGASVSMSDSTASTRREKREAVLPPQIMNLENLAYYSKFGSGDWFKNKIPYYPWGKHEVVPEFLERPASFFQTANIQYPNIEDYFDNER